MFHLISPPSEKSKKNESSRATHDRLRAGASAGAQAGHHLAPQVWESLQVRALRPLLRGRGRGAGSGEAQARLRARAQAAVSERGTPGLGVRDAAAFLLGSAVALAPSSSVLPRAKLQKQSQEAVRQAPAGKNSKTLWGC